MFFDLNINTTDASNLVSLLEQEVKLGYSAIALNVTVAGRIQSEHSVSNPVFKTYDIVAVQPMSDKVWEKTTKDLDIDVITFDLAQRIPVQLKIPKVREAISRGIHFEVTYSSALTDPSQRRTALANALNLVRLTGGRNLIFSSAARKAMDLRGPYDVANLGMMFGIKQDSALAAVSANCASVIAHGQIRKSVMGVFTVMPRSALAPGDEWKIDMSKRSELPPSQGLALLGERDEAKAKAKERRDKKRSKQKQQKEALAEASAPTAKGISAALSRAPAAAPPPAAAKAGAPAQHKRKSSKSGAGTPGEQPLKRTAGSEKDTDSDMGTAVNTLKLQDARK